MAGARFRPLGGVTVLDWTEGVAGPYACQVLGDLGADVIKIERPQGDWGRSMGGGSPLGGHNFRALNRNRRNVCLDLRRDEARGVAWRLVEKAGVMVSSYRPGVVERLGFGYEDVHARASHLVYARISAYGASGPLARRPGSDTIMQAVSGLMSLIGEPEEDPQRVGVPVVDFLAGRDAVIGVLAALLAAAGGGSVPGPVDVSLFGSAASLQSQVWQRFLDAGIVQRRTGRRTAGIAPAGLYRTKDGRHVAVAVLRDEHFARLCAALDAPELLEDARFATNDDRLRYREELEALLAPRFAARDFDEWTCVLLEHDVLAAPVTDVSDIAADPALMAAVPLVRLPDGPLGVAGPAIGLPIRFGDASPDGAVPPVPRGQHTREVLAWAGYGPREIDELVRGGAVQEPPP
jgi:crotonobetainyl-CoA:carnitine CoA-transferase CaiB-like acyl-CoA transferase